MKVMIIGSGAREHALAWKISQSPRLKKLYIAPGNGGTEEIAENVPIRVEDIDKLILFAKEEKVDITVVGPDNPLANGIVDSFQEAGLRIFGPTRNAAEIETSKLFAKNAMYKKQVPTASHRFFTGYKSALNYLERCKKPVVLKVNGLALGKGVHICKDLEEARKALRDIMIHCIYGDAGGKVLIEDFINGPEVSIHAFCDGETSVLMPASRDYKKVFDGGEGLNTGGMGSFAPVREVNDDMLINIKRVTVDPIIDFLHQYKRDFIGCLYPGLKITQGGPVVLEYNARFGDPETQVYMRLLKTDLLDIIEACIEGRLSEVNIEWSHQFAVCVVIASGGYPGEYRIGHLIEGLKEANSLSDVVVFHAGTWNSPAGIITAGGRVLSITATGGTLESAREKAYEAVSSISFWDMHFRRDIGLKGSF